MILGVDPLLSGTIDLGVAAGDQVKVSSAKGAISTAVAPDASIPEGTGVMAWNQDGASPAALIDIAVPITEVRVETIS